MPAVIGAAVAAGYAREGARVCVADLEYDLAQHTAKAIGNDSFAFDLNVTNPVFD